MSLSPSLIWGNLKIMPLTDLKFLSLDALLLTSIIFLSSLASNLLYLFAELLWQQSMPPTLWDNDLRAGHASYEP